ncbi:nucleotidyl transferase AbiEii/AbiGii toxin family protein [Alkalicoccus halolimnae]|uniref:nucleotidyl transferase AbiEii/AbiGii toxin family protein n=1 Tax=Alkalicoccus halolimnae TaxID=1667239 RepID=UPI0011CA3619|nr:nucleotidyl transferase AbiEii/AbiGii toxin family protein [Alkalicoccus halolimnae]
MGEGDGSLLTTFTPSIAFKGGTSLSKCYNVIKRVSEDFDLTVELEELSENYPESKETIKRKYDLDGSLTNTKLPMKKLQGMH